MLVVACGFIVLGVWLNLLVPRFLRDITLIVTGNMQGSIWGLGGAMLGVAVASMVTAVIVAWIGSVVSSSHSARLREKLFNHVQNFSVAEMKHFSVASLITRSTNDINNVRLFTAMAIQMLISSPVTAVWAILEILDTSWELSMVTIVSVVSLIVVMVLIIVIAIPRYNKIQKLTDKLNQVTRENITGIRVVRAYNAQEFEQQKFDQANVNLTRNNLVVWRAMWLFWPFIGMLLAMLNVSIYWVGSWIITSGRTDDPARFFGDMMVFSQYSALIIFSFMMLITVLVLAPRTFVSAKRINEVLQTDSSIAGSGILPGDRLPNTPLIEFKNVNFKYPGAEEGVLNDVNLVIKPGETVAFIGGTGCGKSTLVNLLPRIYDPTSGEVLLDGKCIKDMSLEELGQIVGYIPQTAIIFSGTIRSNVAFGIDVSDEEIQQALETAQAKEFVDKLEDGLDSEVSQKGKNLSGGQKQRLAIARVIARRPKIYVFDDTFSALDYKTDRALRNALKSQTKGSTVLIVAQRIGTIKDCDRIYVIDKGRIISNGTHKELMEGCDVYKEIALSQLSKKELGG